MKLIEIWKQAAEQISFGKYHIDFPGGMGNARNLKIGFGH